MCLHRKEELQGFLQHLNSIHPDVEFTELEQNSVIPFQDVLLSRRIDG
jgi:hypothetical protein